VKLSIGPFSIHALGTGTVIENEDGTMDVHVRSREGNLTGTLFLTSTDVKSIKERRVRKVATQSSRTEEIKHAFRGHSGSRNQNRDT